MTVRELIALLYRAEDLPEGLDTLLYFEDSDGNIFPIQDAELYMMYSAPVLTLYNTD